MPKVSLVTVNLNNSMGLRKTIESVINQTFNDYEYIVIDGGSRDGSVEVIKEYAEKITYWVSEPDNGIYNAMNKGILKAKGEYLQFLNSGDSLANSRILAKVFAVTRTADIIYGHLNNVFEKDCKIVRLPDEQQFSLIYFFNNTIPHPASFIARRKFNNCLYDESYKIASDKKFFVDNIIIQNCTLQLIDEAIVNFDTKGISSRSENKSIIEEEESKIFSQLFSPRVVKDYEFYKSNYADINALLNIKKYKISYFGFRMLKRTTRIYKKHFG